MATVAVTPVRLVGEHAELLPMEPGHTAALYEAGRAPEIWDYMPARVATLEDMARLVREALRAQAEGHELPFVIRTRPAGSRAARASSRSRRPTGGSRSGGRGSRRTCGARR
jgi:hypothetical protein